MKIGCTAANDRIDAINTKINLIKNYNFIDLDHICTPVDIVLMLGGDGFALTCIHKYIHFNPMFYGINYGTIGFLMNSKDITENKNFKDLILYNSQEFTINPLKAEIIDIDNKEHHLMAINEVTLLRQTSQTAKFKISVNGVSQMPQMMGDGVLVSTPIGSTAYNFSVDGPILPINCNLLAVTPISAFRPRYWRGAMLENNSVINIEVLEYLKRPVGLTADFNAIDNVIKVEISLDKTLEIKLLFDKSFSLHDRIMREQFMLYS